MPGPAAALLSLALQPALACAGEACHRRDTERLEVLPGCTQTAPGALAPSADARARLRLDENGLAALQAGSQCYYLRRDGTHLPVIHLRQRPGLLRPRLGPRAWTAGSATTPPLQPALAARFDGGFPFRNGSAGVCDGCREGAADAGGHTDIVGGTRLRIDRQGNALPDSP